MADFAAVLRKIIESLGENTPEMRERVYDKARVTIEGRLAEISPPPPTAVIERQRKALEDAIAVVRADYPPTFSDANDLFAGFADSPSTVDLANITAQESALGNASQYAQVSDFLSNHSAPPEPTVERGPKFALRGGKLSAVPSHPNADETERQSALHGQLRSALARSDQLLARIENRHPELVATFRDYQKILAAETSELDVFGVWSVGGVLLAFADAYRAQNVERTTSEPLEPAAEALLAGVGRIHGAFVMGFSESRDLVERADEFADTGSLPEDSRASALQLLEMLASNKELVSPETRQISAHIHDAIHEVGWSAGRTVYSAYLIVRNSIHGIIKHSVGTNGWIAGGVGFAAGGSALMGDPNMTFIHAAVPVLRDHGAQMLAFTKHSPEMRAYVEWALHLLNLDREHHS